MTRSTTRASGHATVDAAGTSAAPPTRTGAKTDAVATPTGRLEFLDALRGIAALVVAVQHIAEVRWVAVLGWSETWFRPGEFGVLVFFLCSGFIIPASMERRNDLVDFWIGRFFRLWPLYLVIVGLILSAWGLIAALSPPAGYRIVGDSLANLTMLQVFTTRPLVIGASWTLGYELVFYLLVSVLFLVGVHRRSATTASVLLIAALGAGGVAGGFLLQLRPGNQWWTFPLAGLLLVVVAATRVAGRGQRTAVVLMGGVIVLALSNQPNGMYFALLLLGSMFTGTVLYRWTAGQTTGRVAAGVFTLAIVVIVAAQYSWHIDYTEPISGRTPQWWTEAGTFVAAYLVVGAALLLRHRRWPRVLTYLGTISYSVYLLHVLVIIVFAAIPLSPWPGFLVMMACTLVGATLTYRFVEKPAIAWGRRVAGARRARLAARSPAA